MEKRAPALDAGVKKTGAQMFGEHQSEAGQERGGVNERGEMKGG